MSLSNRIDSSFVWMYEVVDHGRHLFAMIARYVSLLDFDGLNVSDLVPKLDLSCIDQPLDNCWIITFPDTWLEQLDFEVRLWQMYSD